MGKVIVPENPAISVTRVIARRAPSPSRRVRNEKQLSYSIPACAIPMPNHTASQAQGLVTTDNSATPAAAPTGNQTSISPPQPRSTSRPVNGVSAAITRNASVGPAASCPLVQPVAASRSGSSAGKGSNRPRHRPASARSPTARPPRARPGSQRVKVAELRVQVIQQRPLVRLETAGRQRWFRAGTATRHAPANSRAASPSPPSYRPSPVAPPAPAPPPAAPAADSRHRHCPAYRSGNSRTAPPTNGHPATSRARGRSTATPKSALNRSFHAASMIADRQIAPHQRPLQIEPHHDVQVVMHLIRLGPDEARLHPVDRLVERLGRADPDIAKRLTIRPYSQPVNARPRPIWFS